MSNCQDDFFSFLHVTGLFLSSDRSPTLKPDTKEASFHRVSGPNVDRTAASLSFLRAERTWLNIYKCQQLLLESNLIQSLKSHNTFSKWMYIFFWRLKQGILSHLVIYLSAWQWLYKMKPLEKRTCMCICLSIEHFFFFKYPSLSANKNVEWGLALPSSFIIHNLGLIVTPKRFRLPPKKGPVDVILPCHLSGSSDSFYWQ